MSDRPTGMYSDEQLRRYLQGDVDADLAAQIQSEAERDPELLARIEELGREDFLWLEPSTELLNLAPLSELRDGLQRAVESERGSLPPAQTAQSIRQVWNVMSPPRLAFLAVGLMIGFVSTRIWFEPDIRLPDDKVPRWVTAAIDHTNLYTRETLRPNPLPQEQKLGLLENAGEQLGLDLSGLPGAIEDFEYENSWLMEYEGQAVVQILFLHQDQTPLSLFVLRSSQTDPSIEFGKAGIRRGTVDELSVAKWFEPGYAFLAVGRVTQGQLDKFTWRVIEKIQPAE